MESKYCANCGRITFSKDKVVLCIECATDEETATAYEFIHELEINERYLPVETALLPVLYL